MGHFKVWWRRDFKTTFSLKMAGNGLEMDFLGKKWKEGATQARYTQK
jgi:hypothetical protein